MQKQRCAPDRGYHGNGSGCLVCRWLLRGATLQITGLLLALIENYATFVCPLSVLTSTKGASGRIMTASRLMRMFWQLEKDKKEAEKKTQEEGE